MKFKFFMIFFVFFYNLYSSQVFEMKGLEKPSVLKIGSNKIYIIDGYKVKVFFKKNKNILYTLGKRGEGPGEFTHKPDSIQLFKDRILCSSPYKIIYFSYKGDYISEVKTKKAIRLLQKLSNNSFIGVQKSLSKNSITDINLNLYDSKFNIMKTFHNKVYESKNAKIDLFLRFAQSSYHIETEGDNIIFSDISSDLRVYISNFDGKLISKINKKQQPIKFSKESRNKVIDCWKSNYNRKAIVDLFKISISFPEFFPSIVTWKIANKKVYIITINKSKNMNECLSYDLKSNFIQKTYINIKSDCEILYKWYPLDIFKDHFYQLNENYEKETWELLVSEITHIENRR